MIAVVTDSTCQLTVEEADAAGIKVVPIRVRIDDEEFREGIDLSPAEFYDRIGDGVNLSTSQPPPGDFIATYERLIDDGATAIVSVHVDDASSGTINSARVAAATVPVPVHLVDSKMTSYGLGVQASAIADLVADPEIGFVEVDRLIESLIPAITTVFTLPDIDYTMRGGRMTLLESLEVGSDVMIFGGSGGGYDLLGSGQTVEELTDSMAAALLEGDHLRNVAIAHSAPRTIEFTERLEERMRASELVESVHRYRMSPSIAVHAGPRSAGGFSWPIKERQFVSR
ncbi:MAG: DegV family protein [Acidimicrobiales bacterium]